MQPGSRRLHFFEQAISLIVLGALALTTYVYFFRVPYAGLNFTRGKVFEVYASGSTGNEILEGDRLLRVGEVSWRDFEKNLRQTLFENVRPGQVVPIRLLRDNQEITVNWRYPGPTRSEVIERLTSGWWLPYVFWLSGTISVLFLRPRGKQRGLLIGFFFITAVWLAAGSGPSHWQAWESAILFRAAIWLSLPIYLHLHWEFPRPLGHLPKAIIWSVYGAGIGLAALQWFQLLPRGAYNYAFLLAILGSLALLLAHAMLKPEHRRDIRLIGIMTVAGLLPTLTLAALQILTPFPPVAATGAVLALPLIPAAYLYSAFRQRTGALELRVNRAISLYLFLIVVGTAALILITVTSSWLELSGAATLLGAVAAVLVALVAIILFARFERVVERRLLGIPLAPTHLTETYSGRITTSLDSRDLVEVLAGEILPSLLVRQSALMWIEEEKSCRPFYFNGVAESQLPASDDVPALVEEAGKYRIPPTSTQGQDPFEWIRLALAMRVGEKLAGLWLLGRRDPDDWYSQRDILVLQSIANQTAIALVNIAQADRLHGLFRASINWQELERARLARGIHDTVLNQLAVLATHADNPEPSREFDKSYQKIVTYLREIVHDLRPAMLTYGLRSALEELADELAERAEGSLEIQFDIEQSAARYDSQVEQHLFRIIQQACENAIQHAQAQAIRIEGEVEQTQLSIRVIDDGIGFAGSSLALDHLLMQKHYGLVGMHERAALIGAELKIASAPGAGTQVIVDWKAGKN
jgi:signal transduction histidine kinase